jgi:hypothetical protein
MHHLQKSIPLDLRTFDLKNFKRLPLWVVEYKALQLVARIVVGYCVWFYVVGTLGLYLAALGYGGDAVVSTGSNAGSGNDWSGHPLGFAAFTAIMAFTNTGTRVYKPAAVCVAPALNLSSHTHRMIPYLLVHVVSWGWGFHRAQHPACVSGHAAAGAHHR